MFGHVETSSSSLFKCVIAQTPLIAFSMPEHVARFRKERSAIAFALQFRSQCIFLIPRRCPALASSILFTCSAENQHIIPPILGNERPLSLWKAVMAPKFCFGISGLSPQAGARMSWGFGGSGGYFAGLCILAG